MVVALEAQFGVSERRACVVIGQSRSTQRLGAPSPSTDEERLRAFLRDFAKRHPRWGWRRANDAVLAAGWHINHKKIQRLWREEGLKVPYRKKRKRLTGIGVVVGAMHPIAPNVVWGRIQVTVATNSLNRSAGVSHSRVLRGRSLSNAAMPSSSVWV